MRSFKYILGIQSFATADSGACIIKCNLEDGTYDYVAISEERLMRKKYPYTFPVHSIKYCLDYFKINISKISFVISDYIRVKNWFRSGPSYNVKDFDYIKEKLKISSKKVVQIDHHLAHAASTFYTSDYKNSAILIVDGNGSDLQTNSFFIGKNNKIKLIDTYKGRGIGTLYFNITVNSLNIGFGSEGKTMGLAPYGKKNKGVLKIKSKYKGICTDYSDLMRRMPFNDILAMNNNINYKVFNKRLPSRKKNQNIMSKKWTGIAFDIQNETEKCFAHLGKELSKITKSKNICLAGGVALNSVANQKLFDRNNYKHMHIFPACSDAGIPFGLAIWGVFNLPLGFKKKPKRKKLLNAYTGRDYASKEILKILKKYSINYKEINLKELAKKISDGKVVGWFQGKSEYGPRALGNRSIIADSRSNTIRNYINKVVKHRELYRPFAPAILEEDTKKYFHLNEESPYMLRVAKVKKPKIIPAVTHVDGTARVQTVNVKQNSKFYKLISEFKKITGVGCLLNTSFNDAGEPIVETPLDTLITCSGTKIDLLVIGDYLVDPSKINQKTRRKLIVYREKLIKQNYEKSIKAITTNYSNKEFTVYKNREEPIAYWNAIIKPYYEMEKELKKTNQNKPLILIGTSDHIKILLDLFPKLKSKNIVGAYLYKNNEDINNKKNNNINLRLLKSIKKYKNQARYIIASYEYAYDIERYLKNEQKINNYYKIYSSYSRSLSEYNRLKKYAKI